MIRITNILEVIAEIFVVIFRLLIEVVFQFIFELIFEIGFFIYSYLGLNKNESREEMSILKKIIISLGGALLVTSIIVLLIWIL